jgi:hypothetical protein
MTLKETALPVLELEGSPYEQGLAHGRFARELIAQNLKIYFYRFERETKLPKAEVLRRAGLYLRVIEQCAPQYAEAMRGVAEGARIELLEIAALNARYELIYSEERPSRLQGPSKGKGKLPSLRGRGRGPTAAPASSCYPRNLAMGTCS